MKLISGNTAILADAANRNVQGVRARIVTNGGPFSAGNSTFVQSYTEGNQEGLSQLMGSSRPGHGMGNGCKS